MGPQKPDRGESLSLSVALRIDGVCTRFEAAWQAGQTPRIEDFLGAAEEAEREALLWELLRIEIDCRLQQGRVPAVEEYQGRFPGRDALLREEVEGRVARATGKPRPGESMPTQDEGAGVRTTPHVGGPGPEVVVPGYEVRGLLGRGGMGEVFRAHDPVFDRPLALKVMLAELAGQPGAEARFLAEARVTGKLQHPGIPPVHEIGRLDDGRPFLTMKLIEGRTLQALLRERPSPSEGLPRFVAVFGQVCQAVGYAHSRGVVHRDLKPHNVMVGAFGEVQVMDWGLAKTLASRGREPPEPASGASQRPSGPLDGTGAGTILGTPAYMAPEQARGETDRLDERADVFGLGAILCVILTGKPAFVGADVVAVLRGASSGNVAEAFARLDACGADGELVALAKRCLAPDAAQRPRDAAEVAAAVVAYQAGVEERARQAELDRAAAEARAAAEQARAEEAQARIAAEKKLAEEAQARAEAATAKAKAERRARRVTMGLAGALLLLVLGGGVGIWLAQQQRAEAAERRREADRLTRQAAERGRELLQKGWQKNDKRLLDDARAEADKAVEFAQRGEASPEARREAEELRQEVETKLGQWGRNDRLVTALLDVAAPRETKQYKVTESGTVAALAEPTVEQQFTQAFRAWDEEMDIDRGPLDVIVARLGGQPKPVVEQVVAGLEAWMIDRRRRKDTVGWQRLLRLADRLDGDRDRQGVRALLAGDRLAGERAVAALTPVLLPLSALAEPYRGPTRRRLEQQAVKVDAAREPALAVLSLARALERAGAAPEAEALLRRVLAARAGEGVVLTALGQLLEEQRRWGDAVGCHRAARALRPGLGVALARDLRQAGGAAEAEVVLRRLTDREPHNPELWLDLGALLCDYLHRPAEAEAVFRKAIALRPGYADAHYNLGVALLGQKMDAEAEAAYRRAIALRPDYAQAFNNLGLALRGQRKLKEAEAAFRRAIALKPENALAHNNLGTALFDQGKLKEAEAACRKAIALQPDLAAAHVNLGIALGAQKKYAEAEAACRKAIALQPDLAAAHVNLGLTLSHQKRHAEAEASYRRAIALQPDLAGAHVNLGTALAQQRKLGEAETAFRKAIALRPGDAAAYNGLGALLCDKLSRPAEAEAAFRRAIALKPDYPEAHYNLGNALHEQKRLKEAEAAFRRAIALQPDYAEAHSGLGTALRAQKKAAEAEAAYRKAIALQPDYAEAHSGLGAALRAQKKAAEAEAAYRKAIALQPDLAKAHVGLGNALHNQKRYAEAEAAYRRAIQLQPDYALAYSNLGAALADQKKLVEAEAAFRKADQLRPGDPGFLNNLRLARRWLELDRRLPDLLAAKAKPASPQEQVELAQFCVLYKEFYRAAAGFLADAFRADPRLADDLRAQHRYHGARAAALAAAGKGQDARRLPERVVLTLRRQALRWLRADLAAYTMLAGRDDPKLKQAIRQRLGHWQKDADLASLRDAEALTKLPDHERDAWRRLWADVAALCKKMEARP
jgi:tetratricopeptide (TPR) repeat protein